MTRLEIDSTSKNISMELDLKGETTPVTITIENYRLVSRPEGVFLEFDGVQSSREWLALVCQEISKEMGGVKVPWFLRVVLEK